MMGQIWVMTHSPVIGDWIESKYAKLEASAAQRMAAEHNERTTPDGAGGFEMWYVELIECAS